MAVEIRITAQLRRLFNHYGVELRPGPTTVRHGRTGQDTECSRSVFALYECAVRAGALSTAYHYGPAWWSTAPGHRYLQLAEQGGFRLETDMVADAEKATRAAKDHRFCARALYRAGLNELLH